MLNKLENWFISKRRLIGILSCYQVNSGRQRYWYIDNKAPILLVAHIDTVQTPKLNKGKRTGAGFDDRLGCFGAWSLVHKYPNLFDVLITDFEETGGSTAKYFKSSHDYNFVVELDREGIDFVDYDLAHDDFISDWQGQTDMKQGIGSFSDICCLELPCSKINLGIGVYNSHFVNSGFKPKQFNSQLTKLVSFCKKFKDYHYPENDWNSFYGGFDKGSDSLYQEYLSCFGSDYVYEHVSKETIDAVSFNDNDCMTCLEYDAPGYVLNLDQQWIRCHACNSMGSWNRSYDYDSFTGQL